MAGKKEYRSAVRSRRLIRAAFLELLKEKKFEKITVTDIVNRADVNRSTFYAHYPDVMGLVEEIISEVVERSIQLVNDMDIRDVFRNPSGFLSALISIGQENAELYKYLGKSSISQQQMEYLKSLLLDKTVSEVNLPDSIRQSSGFRLRSSFFINGILGIYQQWMKGELDCTLEDINRELSRILQFSGDDFFPEGL